MKYPVVFLVLVSLSLTGCATANQVTPPPTSVLTHTAQPPNALVTIGDRKIQTVVNGYQWSVGNHSSIADAASDPAANLKKYDASLGGEVMLSFAQKPNNLELAVWFDGKRMSTTPLNESSFRLPKTPGDYTYEVTGHWGNNFVNYDFEVHVH
ncbi:hypothetical protein LLE49_21490 [Alicyclobacillus tolerans]|uniref:hypothetical protein n=1 Tax=Alicyclobacillus tolerans TaxID=90970 RepID=UPI001F20E506|nr:hypothetical protein [Alicyclobacillus tolerans]MCF8567299.1 hypothetical protein [Alicyclobacillus tolerans]